MIYHVTCNTDDNYAQHCCAMLCSLFENNKGYDFHVHILTNKLSERNNKEINGLCQRYQCQYTIYEVNESRLDGVKFRKKRPLTKAAYYRILLPEILDKKIDKVLYIDCDIIILDTIIDIYNIEIESYALAACSDFSPWDNCHRLQLNLGLNDYAFCSGLMLINLKFWRECDAINKLLDFSKKERSTIYYHDQDALNYVFRRQWFMLPPIWGRGVLASFQVIPFGRPFDYTDYMERPKLLHYARGILKPWYNVYFPERKYYIKYLELSNYAYPVFIDRTFKQKMEVYIASIKYVINKYLRPWFPPFMEYIIFDIVSILKALYYLFFNRKKLSNLFLEIRKKKQFLK